MLPDATNKWSGPIFEDGVTEQFAISLFVADMNADRRIKEWLEAGRRTGTITRVARHPRSPPPCAGRRPSTKDLMKTDR